MKKIKINNFFTFFLTFMYLEILIKIVLGLKITFYGMITMTLFIIILSLILNMITKLFSEKANKVIYLIIVLLFGVFFCAQYVLESFFGFYLTLSVFKIADQAGSFTGDAINIIISKCVPIIFILLPFILSIVLRNKISFKRLNVKRLIINVVLILITIGLYEGSLYLGKDEDYSLYKLTYELNDTNLTMSNFGMLNGFYLDSKKVIFGFDEKIDNEKIDDNNTKEDEEIVYDPNTLDIDLESFSNDSNSTIKQMNDYFADDYTLKNEYTGIFENKNLILFMAESFNGVVVDKDLTPTLYKLTNGGFVFNNFYNPTMFSTIGGEFAELTGLYQTNVSILSTFRKGTNSFPMGIATEFQSKGYNTYAYHDSYATFQNRDQYLASLGFTNFKGVTEIMPNCGTWPCSDNLMIENTFDEYASSDKPFMVFYATVSGHGDYNANSQYYKKYKDILDNSKYKDAPVESQAYIAGQMELDRALETLLNKLEENGLLENTVIALSGDHAPYYLYEKGISYINAISTYERDSEVELFHSNFILYNSAMDPVQVDKVGSSIDILPTIYNAFGINYDSRFLIGKDILSTSSGLAMVSDSSWVTDKGRYYAKSGKLVDFNGNDITEENTDYIKTINKVVQTKKTMSKYIIEQNYYASLFKYLKTES